MGLNPERMKASEPERDMIRFAFLKALCGKRGKKTAGEAGHGQEAGGQRQGKVEGTSGDLERTPCGRGLCRGLELEWQESSFGDAGVET